MKYIDTDRLRKEVRRLEKAAHKSALGCADSETRRFHEGKDFAYQYVGTLIASLQQELPELDLEKEMDEYFENMAVQEHENIFEDTYHNIARHFAQWGAEHLKK